MNPIILMAESEESGNNHRAINTTDSISSLI